MNKYTDPSIRVVLLPRDTNSQGTIFGGVILSYIDMAEQLRRTVTRAWIASSRWRCAKLSFTIRFLWVIWPASIPRRFAWEILQSPFESWLKLSATARESACA